MLRSTERRATASATQRRKSGGARSTHFSDLRATLHVQDFRGSAAPPGGVSRACAPHRHRASAHGRHSPPRVPTVHRGCGRSEAAGPKCALRRWLARRPHPMQHARASQRAARQPRFAAALAACSHDPSLIQPVSCSGGARGKRPGCACTRWPHPGRRRSAPADHGPPSRAWPAASGALRTPAPRACVVRARRRRRWPPSTRPGAASSAYAAPRHPWRRARSRRCPA